MRYTEEISTLLKTYHLRHTKTRQVLLGLFLQNDAPLSAQDILGEFRKGAKAVNKTTVYRELERLQDKGIISIVRLGDRKQYYELTSRKHHHHLVCLRCEQVEDIGMNERALVAQEQKAQREKQFLVLRHSLEFFGLCKMCS